MLQEMVILQALTQTGLRKQDSTGFSSKKWKGSLQQSVHNGGYKQSDGNQLFQEFH